MDLFDPEVEVGSIGFVANGPAIDLFVSRVPARFIRPYAP